MEFEQAPLLMLGFPLSEDAFLVGLASSEQVIEDASQALARAEYVESPFGYWHYGSRRRDADAIEYVIRKAVGPVIFDVAELDNLCYIAPYYEKVR